MEWKAFIETTNQIIIGLLIGLTIASIFVIACSSYVIARTIVNIDTNLQYIERYDMASGKTDFRVGINGKYWNDKYFCVWTKDRTPEEINNTYCHESCHDFVYKQREHYCGS